MKGLFIQEITAEMFRNGCLESIEALMAEGEIYDIECDPSADVAEVVRCKDCKHYDLAPNGFNGMCNRQYATFYAVDFCSYGERK